MSYDNLSSVSQNVLKFYQQLTGEERRVPSFLVRTISNVLVMEIGWTDVGSGGYILVSCAHSNTSFITRRKVKQYRKNLWITQNRWLDRMSNFKNILPFHNITHYLKISVENNKCVS